MFERVQEINAAGVADLDGRTERAAVPRDLAIGATCSTKGATPTTAPAETLLGDPKVVELYLGALAAHGDE